MSTGSSASICKGETKHGLLALLSETAFSPPLPKSAGGCWLPFGGTIGAILLSESESLAAASKL